MFLLGGARVASAIDPPQTLTVTKAGTGTGTVSSVPAGITCGADCTEAYPYSTVVTLTATPAAGAVFSGWSGHADCSDGAVRMNAAKTCTATFIRPPQTLTVTKAGTGTGTVTSAPAGITCGADCTEAYAYNTVVVLSPTPAVGSAFGGWSGHVDCADGAVRLTAAKTCTATFTPAPPQTLTVTKAGTGTGTVSSAPAGITCGADCTEAYAYNTVVVLTPTPAAGAVFGGWSGHADCFDGAVRMTAAKTCTATFTRPPQTLTVIKTGTGIGTVTSAPAGIACGADCVQAYPYNTVVILTPTPAVGSAFASWSGHADCSEGSITMTAAKTCVATFSAGPFQQVSAGYVHTCGLHADGEVACWGGNADGQASPPGGAFAQISAGYVHTCGLRTDATLACWGGNADGQASPPGGVFTQVSAGYAHTCGLHADGAVACWGGNVFGQASPPAGAFTQVSAGFAHTCGLHADGSVACWGGNADGQASPPGGAFAQVSAGELYTCSLRADGSVACWGSNGSGQASPPAGAFQQVSAGRFHTCGLRTDATVACWGTDFSGQASPPAGAFQQVSAGERHTCGVRADGSVACWGEQAR